MAKIPQPISDLAAEFDKLPGVGPRAALRYAYWLVNQPKDRMKRFAQALLNLAESVERCHVCGLWSENGTCSICSDMQRDRTILCVVATSQDARVIEDSGAFKGAYHVLGGLIDPISGRTPESLNIKALLSRVQENPPSWVKRGLGGVTEEESSDKINELILAFDPDVSGDTTVLYLTKHLADLPIKVTRLARGLPSGAQLEYADSSTLADALKNRKSEK
ncbi:MAG: toprim domain-containing protein [Patescibacteria group bacterium]|nr:recombination protein RecR [Patescibacteria group bacterium]